MSDDLLAAAAAALGAPPEIVMRSAQARASAEGVPVEDVLAAWAGGAPRPAPAEAAPTPVEAAEPAEALVPAETQGSPPPTPPEPTRQAPVPGPIETPTVVAVVAPPQRPIWELPAPRLEGRKESHGRLLLAVVALFLGGLMGAVVLPAFAVERSGTLIVRSEAAEAGRTIYVQEGCWYCHTQLVRPIVTDAHLGPVTEAADLGAELPVTAGIMRLGPDLAHVGSRPVSDDASALEAFLLGEGERPHQSYAYLSDEDLTSLVAYLQTLD